MRIILFIIVVILIAGSFVIGLNNPKESAEVEEFDIASSKGQELAGKYGVMAS